MPSSHLKFFHVPVVRFAIVNGPGRTNCESAADMLADGRDLADIPTLKFTLSLGGYQEFPVATQDFQRKLKFVNTWHHYGDGFYFETFLEGHRMSGFYNMRSRHGWLEVGS